MLCVQHQSCQPIVLFGSYVYIVCACAFLNMIIIAHTIQYALLNTLVVLRNLTSCFVQGTHCLSTSPERLYVVNNKEVASGTL